MIEIHIWGCYTNYCLFPEHVLAPTNSELRAAQTAPSKNVSSQPQASDTAVCQRRKRTVYNQAQLDSLERYFKTNMYPDIHHREQLAKQMCLPESRIQVCMHFWCQPILMSSFCNLSPNHSGHD